MIRSKTGKSHWGGVPHRRIQFDHSYDDIISVENLLDAWKEFLRGKRKKHDVQEFQSKLMDNVLALHYELTNHSYKHGPYRHFKISDPKPRDIHTATVRDRLLHHALHRQLYPFFDRGWIADSYSCRKGKGTHRAMSRFRSFACGILAKHDACWVLKCDIRKFFASIDQEILLAIVRSYIPNQRTNALVAEIVGSFQSTEGGKGLPLGNLTSQIFVNVYMNEFDQFAKHKLKAKHYIRYADDFVILSHDRAWLHTLLPGIAEFLDTKLKLSLHPRKISVSTFASGVDFLGWIHFPDHRILRTSTKRRMLGRVKNSENELVLMSYTGLLSHGNAHTLAAPLRQQLEGMKKTKLSLQACI